MAELAASFTSYLESFFVKVLLVVRPHLDAESIQKLAAEAAARSYQCSKDHPYATGYAVLNIGLVAVLGPGWLTGPLLQLVGFGPLGPIAGTMATWYQSTWLAGYIPAGSLFSMLQGWAMTI